MNLKKQFLFLLSILLLFTGCTLNSSPSQRIDPKIVQNGEYESIYYRGIYIGQVDNNFIEIKSNEEYKVYYIGNIEDKFKSQNINDGDKIEYSFYKNEKGQLILIDIRKY